MTPSSKVYNAFLEQITDDMYMELTKEDTIKLLDELLNEAIPWFEFPRQSLQMEQLDADSSEMYFINDLTDEEIKILATYMIVQWFGQQLASIENVRQKYSAADFKLTSQASHMAKIQSARKEYERIGLHLQRLYKRRESNGQGGYRPTMHTLMEDDGIERGN